MRLLTTRALSATSLFLLTLITSTHSSAEFTPDPKTCQILGDADVYGLGIRLNFYLQWAAIVFATWIAPEQVHLGRQISNIVTISVYTNTFLGVRNGNLIAAEWWIVYFETFVLTLGFVPLSMILKKRSVFDLGFLGVLWGMIVFAQCWLWFKGVDLDHKEGCMIKIFLLFFEVNVENKKWRTVFQVGSVISAVFATAFLIFALMRGWEKRKKERGVEEGTAPQPVANVEGNVKLFILKAGLTVFQLTLGALAILQIEMTMKINHVDVSATPLTSSGQLIGFLNGICTLGVVFAISIKEWMKKMFH